MVDACGVLHLQLAASQPPGHQPVGEGFPSLFWRVTPPEEDAGNCVES